MRLLVVWCFDAADFLCADFLAESINEIIQGFLAFITKETASDCHFSFCFFLFAHNDHVRNFCEPCLTDLVANLFGTLVYGAEDTVFL